MSVTLRTVPNESNTGVVRIYHCVFDLSPLPRCTSAQRRSWPTAPRPSRPAASSSRTCSTASGERGSGERRARGTWEVGAGSGGTRAGATLRCAVVTALLRRAAPPRLRWRGELGGAVSPRQSPSRLARSPFAFNLRWRNTRPSSPAPSAPSTASRRDGGARKEKQAPPLVDSCPAARWLFPPPPPLWAPGPAAGRALARIAPPLCLRTASNLPCCALRLRLRRWSGSRPTRCSWRPSAARASPRRGRACSPDTPCAALRCAALRASELSWALPAAPAAVFSRRSAVQPVRSARLWLAAHQARARRLLRPRPQVSRADLAAAVAQRTRHWEFDAECLVGARGIVPELPRIRHPHLC